MSNPNLTPPRINALNAVNLRLFGITHGYKPRGEQQLVGITDNDYNDALNAVRSLDVANGDRLAIEANGPYAWTDNAANIAHIVPATIPDIPLEEMPRELQDGIANLLEQGRSSLRINNIVYAAAHAALQGIPVYMADSSPEEWQALKEELQTTVPDNYHNETRLYFRNSKMLSKLGDIAIEMTAQPVNHTARKPTLLFLSGLTHTERFTHRLGSHSVSFMSNIPNLAEQDEANSL